MVDLARVLGLNSLSGLFRPKSDNLIPKLLLIVGVVRQSVFNRFIEFSHLGVNNKVLLTQLYVLKDIFFEGKEEIELITLRLVLLYILS